MSIPCSRYSGSEHGDTPMLFHSETFLLGMNGRQRTLTCCGKILPNSQAPLIRIINIFSVTTARSRLSEQSVREAFTKTCLYTTSPRQRDNLKCPEKSGRVSGRASRRQAAPHGRGLLNYDATDRTFPDPYDRSAYDRLRPRARFRPAIAKLNHR